MLKELKELYQNCPRVKRCLAEHPEDCVACLCPNDDNSRRCQFKPDYSKVPVPGRKIAFIKGNAPDKVKQYIIDNE